MTHSLYFANPGEIDPRLITTLGTSVKSEGAIGKFGTGLKYAIAGVLRLGGEIEIETSECLFEFRTREISIKGRLFKIVTMNGLDLGFTTDLGMAWEPWQLYRELRANAEDELGGVIEDESELDSRDRASTVITVRCAEISEAHVLRSETWIEDEPLAKIGDIEVYEGTSLYLFYRNMRATLGDESKAHWAFRYSLQVGDLTEDRTLASEHSAEATIRDGLLQCSNRELLSAVFDSDREASLPTGYSVSPSPEFKERVLTRIRNKLRVPAWARNAVIHEAKAEVEQAENLIPATWPEMLEQAPAQAPEVTEYMYAWGNQMNARMRGLEIELKYWRGCAGALAQQLRYEVEASTESTLDDEVPF